MVTYTHTKTGSIESADDERFHWFCGQQGFVIDKVAGRGIHLNPGGYAKTEGWGTDPAPADVVAAARAFALEIDAEDERIRVAQESAARARRDEAIAVVMAVPAEAEAELAAINKGYAERARGINEGGYGYVPRFSWDDKVGKEILTRHGMTQDQISQIEAALRILAT